MADKQSLQDKLRTMAPKAWRESPSSPHMTYPCFVYRPSKPKVNRADNIAWLIHDCWNVIYISQEENREIIKEMLEAFPYCEFDRLYESDQLYHYSFTLHY